MRKYDIFQLARKVKNPPETRIESLQLLYEDPVSNYFFYSFKKSFNGDNFLLISPSRVEGQIKSNSYVRLQEISLDVLNSIMDSGSSDSSTNIAVALTSASKVKKYVENFGIQRRNWSRLNQFIEEEYGVGENRDERIALAKSLWYQQMKDKRNLIPTHFDGFYMYPYEFDSALVTNIYPEQSIEAWLKPLISQNGVNEFLVELGLSRIVHVPYARSNEPLVKYTPWTIVLGSSGVAKSSVFEICTGQIGTGALNKMSSLFGYRLPDDKKSQIGTMENQGGHIVFDEFDQTKIQLDTLKQVARSGSQLISVSVGHTLRTTYTFNFIANIKIPRQSELHSVIYDEFAELMSDKITDYNSVFARAYLYIIPSTKTPKGSFRLKNEISTLLDACRPILNDVFLLCLRDEEIVYWLEHTEAPASYRDQLDVWSSRSSQTIYSEISKAYVNVPRVVNSLALSRSLLAFSVEELQSMNSEGKLSDDQKQKLIEHMVFWQDHFYGGVVASISMLAQSNKLAVPDVIKSQIEQRCTSEMKKVFLYTGIMFTAVMLDIAKNIKTEQTEQTEQSDAISCFFELTRPYHSDLLLYVFKEVFASVIVDKRSGTSKSTMIKRSDGKVAKDMLDYLQIAHFTEQNTDNHQSVRFQIPKCSVFLGSWIPKNIHRSEAICNTFLQCNEPNFIHHIQPLRNEFIRRFNQNLKLKDIINV